jgi:hypothetical protein
VTEQHAHAGGDARKPASPVEADLTQSTQENSRAQVKSGIQPAFERKFGEAFVAPRRSAALYCDRWTPTMAFSIRQGTLA